MTRHFAPLLLVFLFIQCAQPEKPVENTNAPQWTPSSWIDGRVEESTSHLQLSNAGTKLLASINAHGGLGKWFETGPVKFHFDYQPLDGGTRRNTVQTVDKWSALAVHEVFDNPSIQFGWDGTQAWSVADSGQLTMNPRFWSLTPYYFIGLPFVLADQGVILEDIEDVVFKGKTYDLIKASYEQGTGDASEDFYVIYIDPETKLIAGLRYIVSYPGFFTNGGHSPEKFMEIRGLQSVEGIQIPTGYYTHWWKADTVAELITQIDVSDVSFDNELAKDYFEIPEKATIQQGL